MTCPNVTLLNCIDHHCTCSWFDEHVTMEPIVIKGMYAIDLHGVMGPGASEYV